MIRYVTRRMTIAVAMLFALTAGTFVFYATVPANPGKLLLGQFRHPTNEQLALANKALGNDRPLATQYVDWVRDAFHGDLGFSWGTGVYDLHGHVENPTPVTETIVPAARVSLSVLAGGLALLLILVVPLAAICARRPGSRFDRLTAGFLLIGISTHPLVVGLLLQAFASHKLQLLPAQGYCPVKPLPQTLTSYTGPALSPYCSGLGPWFEHLVLPWITFAMFFAALYVRVLRASLMDTLEEPYVATARAKGASESRVVLRHALPNALRPILTMTGMEVGTALSILIYVEVVYGLPGLGRLSLSAFNGEAGYDRPTIVALVLFLGIAIFGVNLIVDLLYPVVDKRIGRRTPERGLAPAAPGA